MIAKLGLGLPKDILVDPQLFAVRTIDLNNNLERLYQRFYFNMDREKFDRWLVSIIPSSIDKRFNSIFKSFVHIPGGYEIRYIYRPRRVSQLFAGRDNIALIGEAAGAISPSSAEGFSYAFKSALYLAESLEEGIEGFLKRYSHRAKKSNLIYL